MGEKYKRRPNTTCSICGTPIYKRPSIIKSGKGNVFCSQTCYGISCRREKPCVVCGKLILSGLHKSTCSRACANINRVGIKYHLGRPKDKVRTQYLLKMRLANVRGKVCERCGYNKFEILQVHHKDRDRNNNDLENLEIICPNCHYEEHHLFGKDRLKK